EMRQVMPREAANPSRAGSTFGGTHRKSSTAISLQFIRCCTAGRVRQGAPAPVRWPSEPLEKLGRNSTDQRMRFHVIGDHGTGGDHGACADDNAAENRSVCADPGSLTHNDRSTLQGSCTPVRATELMPCRPECYTRSDRHTRLDTHFAAN